jgi:hypothetical protein
VRGERILRRARRLRDVLLCRLLGVPGVLERGLILDVLIDHRAAAKQKSGNRGCKRG